MKHPASFLLDTNTISYLIANRLPATRQLAESLSPGSRLLLSAICEAEILTGLERRGSAKLLHAFHDFSASLERVAWDSHAAVSYAKLGTYLRGTGLSLTLLDAMIAAHALSLGATLVTHDRALHRVSPYLSVVDWAAT